MARCPLCDCEMREVSARANPGTLIVLDQCKKCGGIWCDKWELFPIDAQEAERLDPVDPELLGAPAKLRKSPLYCPRCTGRLQIFRDPDLPQDIQLERCPRCDGIWLNRGQFGRFKRRQREIRSEKLGNDEALQRLVQSYYDPGSWVTTGVRGIFAYPQAAMESEEAASGALKGALSLILQALFRLVLRL